MDDGRVTNRGDKSAVGHAHVRQIGPSARALVDPIPRLAGGVIVSCQAGPADPMHGPLFMAAMARAAAAGGAVAIRANGPEDIAAIRTAVDLPIIGIWKVELPGFGIRITPAVEHARAVAAAGASIIALDATDRPRSDGMAVADFIARVRVETELPVMADVSTISEALGAQEAGADLIATTLAGYMDGELASDGPDFELVAQLVPLLSVPLIAEGRISTPDEAARAIALGAYAVVVGHAVTRPEWITAQFVAALRAR